jgi:hypothetical protein
VIVPDKLELSIEDRILVLSQAVQNTSLLTTVSKTGNIATLLSSILSSIVATFSHFHSRGYFTREKAIEHTKHIALDPIARGVMSVLKVYVPCIGEDPSNLRSAMVEALEKMDKETIPASSSSSSSSAPKRASHVIRYCPDRETEEYWMKIISNNNAIYASIVRMYSIQLKLLHSMQKPIEVSIFLYLFIQLCKIMDLIEPNQPEAIRDHVVVYTTNVCTNFINTLISHPNVCICAVGECKLAEESQTQVQTLSSNASKDAVTNLLQPSDGSGSCVIS